MHEHGFSGRYTNQFRVPHTPHSYPECLDGEAPADVNGSKNMLTIHQIEMRKKPGKIALHQFELKLDFRIPFADIHDRVIELSQNVIEGAHKDLES